MKKFSKKRKRYILFAIVLSVISISAIYAKYKNSINVSGDFSSNEFAEYYLTVGGEPTGAISLTNLNPGSRVIIPILVSNADRFEGEKKQSEIDLQYDIAVVTTNHLPLTFMVRDTKGEQLKVTEIESGDEPYDNRGRKIVFGKSSSDKELLFSKDKVEEIRYEIVVEWPVSKDEFEYTKEIDQLYILVEAKQALPR